MVTDVQTYRQSVKSSLPVRFAYALLYLVLAMIALSTVWPLINTISVSFSSPRAILSGQVTSWPIEFNLDNYKTLISNGTLFIGMKNTLVITVIGTCLNLLMTVMAAYPFSKKRIMGRNVMLVGILFTMIFTAGLIPNFIWIRNLGLYDSYWALWLPGLISTYYMFVMKTYFEALPSELEEAATIDGANDVMILVRIVLPLSAPMLTALGLFYAVGWWNAYFGVLIYITSPTKQSLMVILYGMLQRIQDILQLLTETGLSSAQEEKLTPEGLKAAAIVTAVLPILCVYPFLQRFFVKGVLIGSVKG